MSLFNTAPRYSTTAPAIRSAVGSFLTHIRRLIDHGIAALIARHERQADLFYLRRLSDRELKDMGLTRGDVGVGLVEAAKSRMAKQQRERS